MLLLLLLLLAGILLLREVSFFRLNLYLFQDSLFQDGPEKAS